MISSRTLLPTAFVALLLVAAWSKSLASAAPQEPFQRAAGEAPRSLPEPGTFPPSWIRGTNCGEDPTIQVHAYNDDLWILRQSKCTHFEAPFVYVIFGLERALVIDTGAPGSPGFGEAVMGLVDSWSRKNGVTDLEVLVAHSHSHSDHIQGDGEFAGLENVTVVGLGFSQVLSSFGFDFAEWPTEERTLDLGGRVLDVLTTPGHSPTSLTFYDRRTHLLLTGDLVYPGHLFVFSQADWPVFQESIERLVNFASTHPVEWVLGCHIEWSDQPGGCYSWGTAVHPTEHVLQLHPHVLKEIHDVARRMGDDPVCGDVQRDFVIHPVFRCGITGGC